MTFRKPAPSAYMESLIHQIERDMNERERQLYLALPNKHDHEPYGEDEDVAYLEKLHRILETNVRSFGTDVVYVFLQAYRFNHACDNNAHGTWNENTEQYTVHALRDYQKGEEITVYCYLISVDKKNRRANKKS
jgi:hypothetical protein